MTSRLSRRTVQEDIIIATTLPLDEVAPTKDDSKLRGCASVCRAFIQDQGGWCKWHELVSWAERHGYESKHLSDLFGRDSRYGAVFINYTRLKEDCPEYFQRGERDAHTEVA